MNSFITEYTKYYSFLQTSFPLTHVLSTLPLRFRITKSPGRSVLFRFSIMRHHAGLNATHLIASPSERPVKREKAKDAGIQRDDAEPTNRLERVTSGIYETHLPARVSVSNPLKFNTHHSLLALPACVHTPTVILVPSLWAVPSPSLQLPIPIWDSSDRLVVGQLM